MVLTENRTHQLNSDKGEIPILLSETGYVQNMLRKTPRYRKTSEENLTRKYGLEPNILIVCRTELLIVLRTQTSNSSISKNDIYIYTKIYIIYRYRYRYICVE